MGASLLTRKETSDLEQTIDIVHEYTYLGTRNSSTGNFSVSRTLERGSHSRSFRLAEKHRH